eukprot:Blabericola_migrator_1__5602@NODE_284_length_10386_cov_93_763155_g234_i0_p4_GENE_NODE_284_length_10386_cov_93_763155_g234_i0NODE_284_length_10386_cov_93_763155_g234_i0_p4_ORF_typecomplete_len286_score79_25TPR_15/PF13429_6/1_8e05TPR_15/PF13429_6/0_00042ChAPs/PF09295_10/0_00019ChAPs/PF09295_10/1_3TPR_19/PF14559_6/50TPR_19/PF14559_6/0_013TPR_16/PF13432_6/2e03TPR_16/PF13432_6/2_8e03TPR_16/PF13432_6/83TPR_16/PF13432_6/0_022FAT/PF02259_23/17FAT/PF02259_23/0_2NRDE2/PF08424_10/3_3e02NRDE2/PF08424_10/0_0
MDYSKLLASFEEAITNDDPIKGCQAGYELMNTYHDKLDNEKGDEFKEKLLLFAHRIGDTEWVKALWKHLDKRHPDSKRVDRLGVLAILTSQKKLDSSTLKAPAALLESVVNSDPTNASYRRTLLATAMAAADSKSQIAKIYDDYLRDFPMDTHVWISFGEHCRRNALWQEAQTIYEELALVLDRENTTHWLHLAEACSKNGNLCAALKYYSMAVVYEPFCLEALKGVVDVYCQLKTGTAGQEKLQENLELAACACKRICDILEEEGEAAVPDLEKYSRIAGELSA